MSQQSSGLRFDIYERILLPDHSVGVKEINGIELTPEIRVVEQGEQAVLKGHLALSGTYTGEDETRTEEEILSHRIPVEITLPMNRIGSVNDIRVEIDNFDVDLLSPRSLNVTGVLSLVGIEPQAPAEAPAEASWRKEEAVFSHRVEPPPSSAEAAPAETEPPAQLAQREPSAEAAAQAAPPPQAPEPLPTEPEAQPERTEQAAEQAQELQVAAANAEGPEAPLPEPSAASFEEAGKIEAEAPEVEVQAEDNAPEQDVPLEEAQLSAQEEPQPEKQEIKIAFSGKPSSAAEAPLGGNAIMSMASAGTSPAEKRQEPPPEAAETESESKADRLEWKKLFLQSSADAPSFRKVRMCIAQKEDTIETIAERYQKNVREIMLYNRLSDPYVQEGQVVYIP